MLIDVTVGVGVAVGVVGAAAGVTVAAGVGVGVAVADGVTDGVADGVVVDEGVGVPDGVADTDAEAEVVIFAVAVVDAACDVLPAAWLLLVGDVQPLTDTSTREPIKSKGNSYLSGVLIYRFIIRVIGFILHPHCRRDYSRLTNPPFAKSRT